MKFGKQIQSQQIPGWGAFYLDYKFLNKIINSLAANRPASELAALAAGIRPPPPPELLTPSLSASSAGGGLSLSSSPLSSSHSSSTFVQSPSRREVGSSLAGGGEGQAAEDDSAPLPADAVPPTPGFGPRTGGRGRQTGPTISVGGDGPPGMDLDEGGGLFDLGGEALSAGLSGNTREIRSGGNDKRREESEMLLAHRTVFFFKLEREIEKINAFYLQKERDLRLRLLTLLSNRKRILRLTSRSSNGDGIAGTGGKGSTGVQRGNVGGSGGSKLEWRALEEGWAVFERDLGKLQQFIEINAIGFRKILKKWDKRSKSSTKELYLERQVEVQPCFNRAFIAKLSDVVAANLLDLQAGDSEHDDLALDADLDLNDTLDLDRRLEFDMTPNAIYDPLDVLSDLENDLTISIETGEKETILAAFERALEELARFRGGGHSEKDGEGQGEMERCIWKAALGVGEQGGLVDEVVQMIGQEGERSSGAREDDQGIGGSRKKLGWGSVDAINGRTLLHEASVAGKVAFSRHCVQRGVPVSATDAYGRTALHYSTIGGHATLTSFLLSVGADPFVIDQDGYTPLLHAIVHGHIDCVQTLLSLSSTSSSSSDPASSTPAPSSPTTSLLGPTSASLDLIPLSLACLHGHLDLVRLLLLSGAKIIPNSEGLYPQHLAARQGHSAICALLVEMGGPGGGGKDRADKYNQWTPLFHAAVGDGEGHVECVRVLVEAGCDVNVTDEYGKTALFYAAYYGHVGAINILLRAGALVTANKLGLALKNKNLLSSAETLPTTLTSPGSDLELDDPMEGDGDMIPSLSLPPPIVPLQVYGHNYLDKRCLVQLSLGHPFSRSSVDSNSNIPAVRLYGTQDGPLTQTWSSLKLVMTSKPDTTTIPHSVILPLADDKEVFNFQVATESLPDFSLDFSLYPTFGSKLIGRAVVLVSAFEQIKTRQCFVTPLLDHHLKTIGEVAFELSVVRPFVGSKLEINGQVETYWKASSVPTFTGLSQDHGRQFQPHRPLSIPTSSPNILSPSGGIHGSSLSQSTPSAIPSAPSIDGGLVTATSLTGQYVTVVVQVTKDLVPVVFRDHRLPIEGFEMGVADVTIEQFERLAETKGRRLQDARIEGSKGNIAVGVWAGVLSSSMVSLEKMLTALPLALGVNLEVRYTTSSDAQRRSFNNIIEINAFIDSILSTVYSSSSTTTTTTPVGSSSSRSTVPGSFFPLVSSSSSRSSTTTTTTTKATPRSNRKIFFTAFDPDIASFLNLKQPNYAVFFASYCGIARARITEMSDGEGGDGELKPAGVDEEEDKRCMSVREAVKFAKANNLLGLVLDATLIAQVPHLIYSVKESGLLLVTFGRDSDITLLKTGNGIEGLPPVDAYFESDDSITVQSQQ